jgi:hypothetical protein
MIDPAARFRRSSLVVPTAAALAALAGVALASGACGGKVVVDGPPATSTGSTGGSGGSGGSPTFPPSSGVGGAGGSVVTSNGGSQGVGASGTGGCTVVQMPPYVVTLGCEPGNGCPPANTAAAQGIVTMALGLCDPSVSTCCGQDVFKGILCGPSPSDGDCCYVTLTSVDDCE